MADIILISEARPPKPETQVIAEVEGVIAANCYKHYFRCICGDKFVSSVWLSAHCTKEGTGHRRKIVDDE